MCAWVHVLVCLAKSAWAESPTGGHSVKLKLSSDPVRMAVNGCTGREPYATDIASWSTATAADPCVAALVGERTLKRAQATKIAWLPSGVPKLTLLSGGPAMCV